MSGEAVDAADVAGESLAAQVASLRESGAARADPVRLRFIEALAGRMADQPAPVRAVLERKLRAALEEFPRDDGVPPVRSAAKPVAVGACVPLAELNAHIRGVATRRGGNDEAPDSNELASARRFRESWEALRTLERLEQALARSPANAGPLNSHALVVKSLRLVGDLSTDYLRRFLAYAETLQWLESARAQMPRAAGQAPKAGRKSSKPAVRSRRRK